MRVVIADDHAIYRQGLTNLLRKSGIDVVGDASSGDAAIRVVEGTSPDVVLMDVRMPGLSGIEATRRLVEHHPQIPVLALSVSAESDDVTKALQAGAVGYLLKEAPVDEVAEGIAAAAEGRPVVSPWVAAVLLRRVREAILAGMLTPATCLSGRELRVLDMVADGKAEQAIADALDMSASTVRDHAASIVTKLHLEGHLDAVADSKARLEL